MTISIKRVTNGKLRQNCYVVAHENCQCLIIDPGSEHERIVKEIESDNLKPLAILNTHGHYDHVGAVKPLMDRYDLPFYLDRTDERILESANIFRFIFESSTTIDIPGITHDLSNQDTPLEVGDFSITCLKTPGHTPGGQSFFIDDQLFTGDTLFRNGVGRTDLYGGNENDLKRSLELLFTLPSQTVFHSGHGGPSTLHDAKHSNTELKHLLPIVS